MSLAKKFNDFGVAYSFSECRIDLYALGKTEWTKEMTEDQRLELDKEWDEFQKETLRKSKTYVNYHPGDNRRMIIVVWVKVGEKKVWYDCNTCSWWDG